MASSSGVGDDPTVVTLEEFLRGSIGLKTDQQEDEGDEGDDEEREESTDERGSKGTAPYEPDTDIDEQEEVDPRVGTALEELNCAMNEVNSAEKALLEAKQRQQTLKRWAQERCQHLMRRHRAAVRQAAPYYHQRAIASEMERRAQESFREYMEAKREDDEARNRLAKLEEEAHDLNRTHGIDEDVITRLSEASETVAEAGNKKRSAYAQHGQRAAEAARAVEQAERLRNAAKSAVERAKPFFTAKAQAEEEVSAASSRVANLRQQVAQAKQRYQECLRRLESISREIHNDRERRRSPSAEQASACNEDGIQKPSPGEDDAMEEDGIDRKPFSEVCDGKPETDRERGRERWHGESSECCFPRWDGESHGPSA